MSQISPCTLTRGKMHKEQTCLLLPRFKNINCPFSENMFVRVTKHSGVTGLIRFLMLIDTFW